MSVGKGKKTVYLCTAVPNIWRVFDFKMLEFNLIKLNK